MIIKRWTGSAYEELYPKIRLADIYDSSNPTLSILSGGKIMPKYLPDSVFDSLHYFAAIATSSNLSLLASNAYSAWTETRNPKGQYWVVTTQSTLTADLTPVAVNSVYFQTTFIAPEGSGTASSVILEPGDWIILDSITGGPGVLETEPWLVTFAIVNNTYENATTAYAGIVAIGSHTTYSTITGTGVVTESNLKTIIDSSPFSANTHGHGNIGNLGTITTTIVAPADTDVILLSDTSNGGKIERGIQIGTGTGTFLRNDGTWGTPAGTYAHPAYTARSIDTSGVDVLDTFTSDTSGHVTGITTRTLPNATTSAAGVMSSADKTKLDGIATGATNYTHPTYTYTAPSADSTTTLANIAFLSTLAQTNGHVTGGTMRKLVAGSNVTITPTSDGNVTISSTDTNTTYTAGSKSGLFLAGTVFNMVHPFYAQADDPVATTVGTIWFDL